MVYRLSGLAALTATVFALGRLERLLRSSVEGLPWEVILVAATVLGAAITWGALSYRLGTAVVVILNAAALLLTVVRVAVPATTWSVLPTLESFGALGTELGYARDVIRTGVAPVLPLAGVIAILTVVFWVLGALVAWGLLRDRPYLSVIAPLVVYLQFSTMDRRSSGWWTTVFLILLGLGLLAVAFDRRHRGTGLLTSGTGRLPIVRTLPSLAIGTLVVTLLLTALSTQALAGLVPRSGVLEWRVPSGLTGDFTGREQIGYNPFVGIHQQLISPTNTPLFVAEIEGEVDGEALYWRLLTLESFNGEQWFTDGRGVRYPENIDKYEDPFLAFRGPTLPVTQKVTILSLQQDWLPAAYSPTSLESDTPAVARGYLVKTDDAALHFDALSYRSMRYTVESEVPDPDLQLLARDEAGEPTRVFAEAAAAEDGFTVEELEEEPRWLELRDEDNYLILPDEMDPGIAVLAAEQVQDAEGPYEKALALESFFRTPGTFRYRSDIDPGHAASDLADWLLDPESPNHRTGYCEQFATSMAVMARLVDIPSRVVLGFTPGERIEDGRIVVRDRNAHAWVELWMPAQGWVRFDPTPRGDGVNPAALAALPFDVDEYLELPEQTSPEFEGPQLPGQRPFVDPPEEGVIPPLTDEEMPTGAGSNLAIPGWVIAAGLGVLVLFGLIPGVKLLRRWARRRRLERGDISAAWAEIVDRLTDLGDGPAPANTPAEVAARSDEALRPLARVYQETVYGPQRLSSDYDIGKVTIATESLLETERRLGTRYSAARRLVSWYRLTSLTPRWWKRLRSALRA